ncbi:MAG: hypothetical protein ACO20X_14980 [Alphaproteobacteria bacterium]
MHSEDCSASSLLERGRTRATTRTFCEDALQVGARIIGRGAVVGRWLSMIGDLFGYRMMK